MNCAQMAEFGKIKQHDAVCSSSRQSNHLRLPGAIPDICHISRMILANLNKRDRENK